MRIGIDLTWLADNFTGIERYAANMAIHMIALDHENDYVLFFKDEPFQWFADYSDQGLADVVVVPRGRFGKAFFSQFVLPGVMKKESLDLALFMSFPCPFFYGGASVSTIHDLTPYDCPDTMTGKSRLFWKVLDRKAVSGNRTVITVSEFSKGRICDYYGKKPEQVIVSYSGIDDSLFNDESGKGREAEVRAKYGLPERYVLSLSTIEPRKRLDLLVESWAELRARGGYDLDLVLAGRRGWKVDELLASLDEDTLTHVHFTGFVDDRDLPVLYRMSDMFVFPSRYEGFGLPPVEAHDSGAKVLCSDIPCLKEVCGDKAAYFKSGSKEDLVAALLDTKLFEGVSAEPLVYSWEDAACRVLRGLLLIGGDK